MQASLAKKATTPITLSTKWPSLDAGAWAFASFSDLHLGHRRTPTLDMIKGLDESIFKSDLLRYIKILFLAGDVFDRLLNLEDPSVHHIDRWIARLLRACSEHGVILRVLEGTPSHDRRQSERFNTILSLLNIEIDFRYVSEIEIEHIPSLSADVLYIPDEAHPTTTQTQEVVKALMGAKGLEKVDLAIMHGYFQYQLPYQTKEGSFHDIDYYTSIVRHWITIGHVHTRSRMGIVLAQGSHDRVSHGEEGAKGYVVATVGNRKDEAYFIDNPHAAIFKSVEVYDLPVEEALAKVRQVAGELPPHARFRIVGEPSHPIFEFFMQLQLEFPTIQLSKKLKSQGEKSIAEKIVDNVIGKWVPVRLDRESLPAMVEERINKRTLDADCKNRLIRRLRECL